MSKQLKMLVGVAVFATLALAGMVGIFSAAQPVQADGHVTRSFSATQVATDGTVDVEITKVGGGFLASVTETLPDGWDYQSASVESGESVTVTENEQMITFDVLSGEPVTYTVMAPSTDGCGTFSGMASIDNGAASAVAGDMEVTVGAGCDTTTPDPMPDPGDGEFSVTAQPVDPGVVTQITIKFNNPSFLAIDESITFEVEDDLDVPSSIDESDVSIAGDGAVSSADTDRDNPQVAAPSSVIVEYDAPTERHQITLHIADMSTGGSAAEATDDGLAAGQVTVTFRQAAGITNRTEGDVKEGNRGSDDWWVYTSESPAMVRIHDRGPGVRRALAR